MFSVQPGVDHINEVFPYSVTCVFSLCRVGHHVSFKKKTLFLCLNKNRLKQTLRSGGVTFTSKSIKFLFYEMF